MQSKPIVTFHGNPVLFSSLHKAVVEGLPKEAAEWRRSYGRPAPSVLLEASFAPYDDDILPEETDKTLTSRPYFHIFWTDCDLETYKQKVKEEISDWRAALKGKTIPDWLIVVVNSDENKVKSKLLPRSSTYDKIKSDFCGKHPDRIVQLTDPLKTDKKNVDMWNIFLARLRQLLLQAFTRHLQKYEDNMRSLREKRNEVGWNFQQYFIVQEELAFMFEMLGLYDDAMIQYDELDALFTQFVLNHASGRLKKIVVDYKRKRAVDVEVHQVIADQLRAVKSILLESVPWLYSLVSPCKCWAGLSLRKAIAWDRRNQIRDTEASLLDFRNYLFSRQCALLLLMKKPGEIVQRAIDYLHETVQEMKTLNIEIGEGGLDCWVFLSGLEVLQRCSTLIDDGHPRQQALNTAYLWDYVCRKLHKLGEMCGLMPGSSQAPSSAQLSLVVDLTSGMGLEESDDDDEEAEGKPSLRPRDKLREALSSRESFQKIYLEQSELAMGTFKYIGRFRSARMIGKNLADFYMKLGEPHKAENFLLDAMKSYHQEGWKQLRDTARLELATCQHQVADQQKYVKTASQVASSSLLETKDRVYHLKQVLDIAKHYKGGPIILKAFPLLDITVISISAMQVTLDQSFQIRAVIVNNSPCDIPCDSIWLTLEDCLPDIQGTDPRLASLKTPLSRQISNSSLEGRNVMNLPPAEKKVPHSINLQYHYEGCPNEPESTGIACVNSHEVLKRKDSSGVSVKADRDSVVKDSVSQSVSREGMVLKLGENHVELNCEVSVSREGMVLKSGENNVELNCEGIAAGTYKPGQIGVKVDHLEYLGALDSDLVVSVVCENTVFKISQDNLIAGRRQEVSVHLHTGSTPIEAGSKVKVMSLDEVTIEMGHEDNTVELEGAPHRETVDWPVTVFQEPCVTSEQEILAKIAFDCSWLPRPLLTTISFRNPFSITHKVLTAGSLKYIQVIVEGHHEEQFSLTDWALTVSNTTDVQLVSLNKPGQTLCVNIQQSASYIWMVKSNIMELPPLDLVFTAQYSYLTDDRTDDEDSPRTTTYKFSISNFQTMFTVSADVTPCNDDKFCKTGSLATLRLAIKQVSDSTLSADQEFMYEIGNQSNWKLHGKSTGIFLMQDRSYSATLELMPLVTGFIPLPRVKLCKYSPAKSSKEIWLQKASLEQEDTLESTDEEETSDNESMYPTHSEFSPGQVYYSSIGKQVHVYPEHGTGDIEVFTL